MKQFLYAATFLLPLVSVAQPAAPDTVVRRSYSQAVMLPATIRLLGGGTVQGYVSIPTMYPGIGRNFSYYLTNPKSKPRPKRQKMEITRVHSITAGPHYLETMLLPDELDDELYDPEILAERFVNGPVEVFLQAEEQSVPVPIPVAGSILSAAIPYTNSLFFVRRKGLLMQVDRGTFREVMSQYLQDAPELAAKVRAGEKNYHYRNLISIITEFNAYVGRPVGSGR
ncbi:hypothetical protein E5K00_21185 [Hymenobacter aquaticus]|uniref:DUF4294 domain-containing protein n=1 Tax=Hymenobacter aquaticus TaxID=1867101 RepID=A0A4Z0PS05_9BACT|nr:hypothetical protein [Hymenobacter aquaticus]TGE20510.1 hypothetical protein E5K00_21185 [Hymenobacter aquaticus]